MNTAGRTLLPFVRAWLATEEGQRATSRSGLVPNMSGVKSSFSTWLASRLGSTTSIEIETTGFAEALAWALMEARSTVESAPTPSMEFF